MAARAQTTSDKTGTDAEILADSSPEDSTARRGFVGLLPLVGLGFWQAWWMTLASTSVVMGPIQPAPGSMLLLLIMTLAGYVAATLAAPRLAPYSNRPGLLWLAAAAGAAGTVMLALCTHVALPHAAGLFLEWASYILTSVFSALVLLMWGERWSTLASGNVGRHLVYSFLLAFALYFVVCALPVVAGCALIALFAPLSALSLHLSRNEPCRGDIPVAAVHLETRRLIGFALALVAISVVFGAVQRVSSFDGSTRTLQLLGMSVAGILTAAFAFAMFVRDSVADPFSFYRPIVPAITCGAALCLALPGDLSFLGNGGVIFGVYCLDMFIMFAASDLAYRAHTQVALIFGSAIVATRAGTLIGSWLGYALMSSTFWNPDMRVSLIACFIAAVALIGSTVFTEDGLRTLYQPAQEQTRSHVPNFDERCKHLAHDAGLTARELDVMLLLARGRSIAHISEALGIAPGTVKHHTSNTYRKLGVYDRQGLIDLVCEAASSE